MLDRARELARYGHRPQMIESVLAANGFPEAAEWIEQPHISRELKDLADEARKARQQTGHNQEDQDGTEND